MSVIPIDTYCDVLLMSVMSDCPVMWNLQSCNCDVIIPVMYYDLYNNFLQNVLHGSFTLEDVFGV